MEQNQTPSTTPPPPDHQQPPQNPQSLPSTTAPPPSTTPNSNPTATLTAKPPITPQSQTRPPFNTRPWQQPTPQYSHFSLPSSPLPPSSSSPSPSASTSSPASISPRGGMAIGVPASTPTQTPPSFASLGPPYASQQIRPPVQGMGITGALGAGSSMRPGGVSVHQSRPPQSSLRPQSSTSSQSPASQNFQGHSMLRVSTLGSPGSPLPSNSQNQPWLSSGTQGRPPLPTTLRPQTSPQSFQQRSHIPQQQHHNMSPTLQQQPVSSSQQSPQPSAPNQSQEHHGQQFPPSRTQQPLSHQQQITRGPGLGSQRPPLGVTQSGALQPGGPNRTANAENEESSSRIVTKRSIQDLLNQIDPSEKLDPEVEDILVDIAEDFVESITTFGCSLAKHRKSSTLEAKDILLHLERNWNMTLPGFGGDEIKTYKKPVVTDVHRERIAAIKKSAVATDTTTKSAGGPSGGNAKGHLAKGPATIGSPPNPKLREVA